MNTGTLGKVYQDGETIVRQGEKGDCMYVIQDGQVEVILETEEQEIRIAVSGKGDFFGEMAILEHEVRGATVRALGKARVLTVDKNNFFRGINNDPSLAFRMLETLSHRIRELDAEMIQPQKSGSVA